MRGPFPPLALQITMLTNIYAEGSVDSKAYCIRRRILQTGCSFKLPSNPQKLLVCAAGRGAWDNDRCKRWAAKMGSFITCSRYKVHLVGWIVSKHTCKLDSALCTMKKHMILLKLPSFQICVWKLKIFSLRETSTLARSRCRLRFRPKCWKWFRRSPTCAELESCLEKGETWFKFATIGFKQQRTVLAYIKLMINTA